MSRVRKRNDSGEILPMARNSGKLIIGHCESSYAEYVAKMRSLAEEVGTPV